MVLEDRAQHHQTSITIAIVAVETCPILVCLVHMICTRPMRGVLADVTWLTFAISCLSDPPMTFEEELDQAAVIY